MRLRMEDEFEEFGCDASEEMGEAPRGHVALGGDLKPDPSKQSATDEVCEDRCPHQDFDNFTATAGQMVKTKVTFEAGEQQLDLPAERIDRADVVPTKVLSRDVGVVKEVATIRSALS